MAMISDLDSRLITLDPAFALNPYINASGLADIDQWPEIKRALDSPPPEYPSSYESVRRDRHRERSRDRRGEMSRQGSGMGGGGGGGGGGLNYTQTIMGPTRSGGAGMRVNGRRTTGDGRGNRDSSDAPSPVEGGETVSTREESSGSRRPRADSAPARGQLVGAPITLGFSLRAGPTIQVPVGSALSFSEAEEPGDMGTERAKPPGESGTSARPDRVAIIDAQGPDLLAATMMDDGSDMDDDVEDYNDAREESILDSKRSSAVVDPLVFASIPIPSSTPVSALTAALNKHIPHLVSTSSYTDSPQPTAEPNPFASLYTSVAAPPGIPCQTIELYFPHSDDPGSPLVVKVRNDASVEEVTGYGLYRYWQDQRGPLLSELEETKWSTVGWGLRIVEDDGEVDEDFPPLDRESKISKFSYGQFAIVEASAGQIKQNAAKQPHIQRRPSRVIASAKVPDQRPSMPHHPSGVSTFQFSDSESGHGEGVGPSVPVKGSYGFSSALGQQLLLRVRVMASADVHFTTTISVPADMYIADLTEILCRKKRLSLPATDWVLCLADMSLAIPLDRTVASLEGRNNLALVRAQWAAQKGLGMARRRGGDPNASIFKRQSDVPGAARYGSAVPDLATAYKKYKVHRKIAIGRHERVLAIDGDYVHIMPSENRAFFDSLKTTSFHISLVSNIKLSGRSGGFKVTVSREGAPKRYEFEAENMRQAQEIVETIQSLMRTHQAERSSMLPPPRTVTKR